MGIFSFLKKKEKKIDPVPLIHDTFASVFERLFNELSKDEYFWNRSKPIIKYECFVIAKFITDYSFITLYSEDFDKEIIEGYQKIIDIYFSKQHDIVFNGKLLFSEMEEIIKEKIENYKSIRRENRPPECWYKIFSVISNNPNLDEINDDIENQENGLDVIKNNPSFNNLIPKCEQKLKRTKKLAKVFMSVEAVFPRSIRLAKTEFRKIKIKKIKSEIKKIEKAEKKKEKGKK